MEFGIILFTIIAICVVFIWKITSIEKHDRFMENESLYNKKQGDVVKAHRSTQDLKSLDSWLKEEVTAAAQKNLEAYKEAERKRKGSYKTPERIREERRTKYEHSSVDQSFGVPTPPIYDPTPTVSDSDFTGGGGSFGGGGSSGSWDDNSSSSYDSGSSSSSYDSGSSSSSSD